MIGQTLGHYKILELLGKGGMGEVFLAEDSRLGRKVALKILSRDLASDADRRQRFELEARAAAALNHPNIVTIHSVEEADGRAFLTLELVDGRTLAETIPAGGLPLDKLLQIAIPLADAVGAAHQRGITHRDLKPANVMVTGDNRVKVLDFGLAKLREELSQQAQSSMPTQALTGEGPSSARWPTWRPNSCRAATSMPARTSSRLAPSSTRWSPVSARSQDPARRRSSGRFCISGPLASRSRRPARRRHDPGPDARDARRGG